MAIQREKVEQAHIVQLLRTIGAQVYVLGTRRRATDYQGTHQSAGLPDLLAFLPRRRSAWGGSLAVLLVVECKAPGGRLRPAQAEFQERCQQADIAHIVGDLDAVIAWLVDHGYVQANQFPHYRQQKASAPCP